MREDNDAVNGPFDADDIGLSSLEESSDDSDSEEDGRVRLSPRQRPAEEVGLDHPLLRQFDTTTKAKQKYALEPLSGPSGAGIGVRGMPFFKRPPHNSVIDILPVGIGFNQSTVSLQNTCDVAGLEASKLQWNPTCTCCACGERRARCANISSWS